MKVDLIRMTGLQDGEEDADPPGGRAGNLCEDGLDVHGRLS